MSHLESLEPNLHVNRCISLEKFPDVPLYLKRLELLNTAIREVPESIKFLHYLEQLNLRRSMIKTLPDSIVELKSLGKLDLSGCSNLVELPKQLPSTLFNLCLQGCKGLESLPVLPLHLIKLNLYDCPSLKSVVGAQQFQYSGSVGGGVGSFFIHMGFGNCFNLDQNAVENIVASALLIIHCLVNNCAYFERVEVIVASDEISKRFKYQSANSAITAVKLNSGWQGFRLVGFIPCVVIDCDDRDAVVIRIFCRFKLKTKGGDYHHFGSSWEYSRTGGLEPESYKSDHVFIWFDKEMLREDKNYEEASFKFDIRGLFNNGRLGDIKVKKCGVEIFYAHAMQEE